MIDLVDVKDKDEYYHKLNVGISLSKMWNSLQAKSEIGLEKSEMGYQLVARVMAGNIARGLRADAELAECLAMCQGAFFPAYGKEGKKIVMQYMKDNGINMSEADLGRNFVEYDLHRTNNIISADFDQKLQELFASDKTPDTFEVAIARFCGKTIDSIKDIEMNSKEHQADFMYQTVREVVHNCIASGQLVESERLQEHVRGISKKEYTVSKGMRDEIYDRIESLSRLYRRETLVGIYEFIGAKEKYNS